MKKLLLFVIVLSTTSYAQKTYDIIKDLNQEKINELKAQVSLVSNYYIDDGYIIKKDSTALANLELFLNNPFDQKISDFKLSDGLKTLERLAQSIKSSDNYTPSPGLGINYKKLLKNDVNTIVPGLTQQDSISSLTSALPTGYSATTYIINAISQFLVDRTKEELTLTFYENFITKLESPITLKIQETPEGNLLEIKIELNKLFENTYLLFESKDYFESPSFGQTWTLAFKKDLLALPFKIEENLKSNKSFNSTPLGHFALVSFDIVKKTKRGEHPMLILEDLSQIYKLKKQDNHEIDEIIALLNLFSKNLTTEITENGLKVPKWINSNELKNLNNIAIKYLVGDIYQQGRKDTILQKFQLRNSENLESLITEESYPKFFNLIKTTLQSYNLIEQKLEALKSSKIELVEKEEETAKRQLKHYTEFLNSVYGLIDETFENYYFLFDNNTYYQSDYYKKYRPIATDIVEFNTAVSNTNYAECLLLTMRFLQHVTGSEKINDNEVLNKIIFYGNFMVDIIGASENNGNIKGIIENYALPVSSYRIKRTHYTSWDVSAYPGIYLGYEFSDSNSLSYGITAPIGISYSYNKEHKTTLESMTQSCTFFFSVIDIGAPFSYRFNNDEAQGLPENIKWEQVFSPGLFFIYGLPKSPLSFGLNAQFAPLLRKIETENQLETKNIFRVGLSVMVDIPLFNLRKVEVKKVKADKNGDKNKNEINTEKSSN